MLFWAFEKLFLTPGTIKLSDVYEELFEKFVCWKGDSIEMMVCAAQGEKTPSSKKQNKLWLLCAQVIFIKSCTETGEKKKSDMIQSY